MPGRRAGASTGGRRQGSVPPAVAAADAYGNACVRWTRYGHSDSEPFWELFSEHLKGPPSGPPPRYAKK